MHFLQMNTFTSSADIKISDWEEDFIWWWIAKHHLNLCKLSAFIDVVYRLTKVYSYS